MLVRRELFNEVEGFDDVYSPAYYEDADLCMKIWKKGFKVYYQPESIIYHYENVTAGESKAVELQNINRRKFILLARQIIVLAKTHRIENISIELSTLKFPKLRMSDEEKAEVLVTNMEMADFTFIEHKTAPEKGWPKIEEVFIITPKKLRKSVERGQIIGQEVNQSRRLATNPGGEITPKELAKAAKKAVEDLPVKVDILSRNDIKKLGMGGVLGVAQGSSEEPQFIILEYFGGKKSEKPIVDFNVLSSNVGVARSIPTV